MNWICWMVFSFALERKKVGEYILPGRTRQLGLRPFLSVSIGANLFIHYTCGGPFPWFFYIH